MNNDTDLAFEEPENTPTPPPEDKPAHTGKPKQYVLEYDGKTGALFKLYLLDFFMRIITIGIYLFWGKTRLRKYILSHHALGGDRFEYTGTGGELFKGFIKVLPILAILFIPLLFKEQYPILMLIYLPLIYCYGIALYGAHRYRYSRTRWRGIRGYLDGSTIGYANLAFGRLLLNIITLGFAVPSSDIAKHKYIMNNAYFGNIKAEFDGHSKVLFGAYIKSMLLVVFLTTLSSIGMFISITAALTIGQVAAGGGMIISVLAFILIFPIARSIYAAALMREKMRGLKIGNLKFICTVNATDLIKLKLGNLLILLLTFGIGYPFTAQRTIRFMARHHIVMGNLDAFQAEQGKDQGLTSGEGLEAGFDIDVGFF